MKSEWFKRWFGEDYIALYPHRDATEAEHAVALIEKTIDSGGFTRVLDLACGAGRHSRPLATRWWTAGLDLSEVLLCLAVSEEVDAAFVRGDMRILPFQDEAFHLVVNLFTSFGYFEDDASHYEVVREVFRVTAVGGTFMLDFLNTAQLRKTLIPYDEQNIDGQIVEQRREISDDDRFVIKRICVRGTGKEYTERVRLFEAGDLSAMMNAAGFLVTEAFGNYDGAPLGNDSPRVILFGTRP
ncbi:MAG: class I SAM-dependent methyltransferase [Gemmatimonadaceae bacterium]